MSAQPSLLTNVAKKHLEPADRQLNIQILARCIGTALNLGSPLKIEVHYVPQARQ
ncbi:MAG: hypothetical protein Q6M04_06285 [Thermostichus sp. BF3_bins_97]